MPRGRLIGFLFLSLSLILAGLILSDAWPYLRGPAPGTSEWYWPYLLRPVGRWWPSVAAGLGLIGVGGWWLRRKEARPGLPLALLVLLNLALQLGFIYADRPAIGAELVDRTLSKASNGYLATAGEIEDLNNALRRYPDLMTTFDNDHARTHPPGFVAAFWLTDHALRRAPQFSETVARPATYWRCTDLWVLARPPATAASLLLWSWLPLLLASLTVIPAYGLSRRWFDPHSALLATMLVATLPALLIFAPSPDQIFACLAVLSLFLLVIGLQGPRPSAGLAAGLLVSLMTFLSIGNVAWAILMGGYGILWCFWPGEERESLRRTRRHWAVLLVFTGGAAALWLVYWLGWGVAPWSIARAGLGQHYELVTSLRRYDWWLGYNLVDFILFAGPPVVIGLIWRVIKALREPKERLAGESRLSLLLVVLLMAINLAGSTRGEVGRLWLVFMPAAALVGGGFLGRQLKDRMGMWLLLSAQVILTLSIGLGWRPFYAVILPIEKPPMSISIPTTLADSVFETPDGRAIRLTGFDAPRVPISPGDTIDVALYWRADGPTLRPYTVFLQLLDSEGVLIAQQDNWPVEGQWPSTCWAAGEVIADRHLISLPDKLSPGRFMLVAGLYDATTGERLRDADGRDALDLTDLLIEHTE